MHSAEGGFLRTPHEDLTVKDIIGPMVPEQMSALAGGEVVYAQTMKPR